MRVVNWQRALVLWFQGKVDILEYHEARARSVSAEFRIPSVLRLKSYVGPFDKKIRLNRHNLLLRDQHTCQYCNQKLEARQLTLDHVLPMARGGKKSWKNLVAACRPCNFKKGNRTPEEARMPLKATPREPEWLPQKSLKDQRDQMPRDWWDYL